jgi:hypothetical protein
MYLQAAWSAVDVGAAEAVVETDKLAWSNLSYKLPEGVGSRACPNCTCARRLMTDVKA